MKNIDLNLFLKGYVTGFLLSNLGVCLFMGVYSQPKNILEFLGYTLMSTIISTRLNTVPYLIFGAIFWVSHWFPQMSAKVRTNLLVFSFVLTQLLYHYLTASDISNSRIFKEVTLLFLMSVCPPLLFKWVRVGMFSAFGSKSHPG